MTTDFIEFFEYQNKRAFSQNANLGLEFVV